MRDLSVLISGAGIAGLALAHWLDRYGAQVTVVERAPRPRPGGQAVDIRGAAVDVAQRMGLLESMRAAHLGMRGMSVVDGTGTELMRSTEETGSGGLLGSGDVELLRDELCDILHGATGATEYVFDDHITALDPEASGVHVRFARGAARRFDVVVGADGQHSGVRVLAFDAEESALRHLGSHLAVFTVPNFLDLDHWQVWLQDEGRGGVVMSARNNTEARAFLGFDSEPLDYDPRDVARHKRIVAERMAGAGWVVPRLLELMHEAADFHFAAMTQVVLPRWSAGRVALLGDAAHCASALSGQGTSLALVGAYVLAGELALTPRVPCDALTRYEGRLRGWVEQNQRLAEANIARRKAQAEGRDAAVVDGPDLEEVKNAIDLPDYAAGKVG